MLYSVALNFEVYACLFDKIVLPAGHSFQDDTRVY